MSSLGSSWQDLMVIRSWDLKGVKGSRVFFKERLRAQEWPMATCRRWLKHGRKAAGMNRALLTLLQCKKETNRGESSDRLRGRAMETLPERTEMELQTSKLTLS